jgi:uncharacterized iron-regulated membrane protein
MRRRPARTFINKATRRLHRWGAILIVIPLLVVIGSGILLQLKKEFGWIQPPTTRGQGPPMTLSLDEILVIARTEPRAEINGWPDIDRLDIRPDRGIVKVRANNHWEVQIDTATGAVLSSAYRRSDLIESIHDGSFFHDLAKLWVFLPSGVILLVLWLTGLYLWALPIVTKRYGKAMRQYRKTHRAPRA